MKLKPIQKQTAPLVSKRLEYDNLRAIRYALYDNAPELGKPCIHKADNKLSRYKFELQAWTDPNAGNKGNIHLVGYLSTGKVFRQTKSYKRLSPYSDWYEKTWDIYKTATQTDLKDCDLVGYTCLMQKQQNGESYGNTIIPQMTVLVGLKDGYNPIVDFRWNDLDDQDSIDSISDKGTWNLYWKYKQCQI